ncbi:hypothetical protein [Sphingobacterium sp. UBA5980]|uniref:hypothetical protein n=1 Tax=Sphingobacterium sp. UBA5980 TaxID=1947504 RepID=UPI0025805B7F|nr:hypothetical protein [Sphingobacterium sp. UBA5980]
MNDILSLNFQELNEFRKNIKNDLAKGNSEITLANVLIKYTWRDYCDSIQTKALIEMNNHPFAKIWLEDQGWFNSESFYSEFQTGYSAKFDYDSRRQILTISSNQYSKMGHFYVVEIKEV